MARKPPKKPRRFDKETRINRALELIETTPRQSVAVRMLMREFEMSSRSAYRDYLAALAICREREAMVEQYTPERVVMGLLLSAEHSQASAEMLAQKLAESDDAKEMAMLGSSIARLNIARNGAWNILAKIKGLISTGKAAGASDGEGVPTLGFENNEQALAYLRDQAKKDSRVHEAIAPILGGNGKMPH